ncbi:MAG: DmsE family decaheme c-type cytochrome [Candidatus Tectomicrobia bacterium]|uniref:DmsE family decaheme c-type cytochrome n=1 Tax=Tectimicrobiota bacterium TaxID=2528274 RepID=A0A932FVG8_UNCTE|nr:DmsE family decaheme c-type cytochrome [Candidatus Tectomicrobia bacterium]
MCQAVLELKGLIFVVLGMVAGLGCAALQHPSLLTDRESPIAWSEVLVGAEYIRDEECSQCHRELVIPFQKTVHARLADFEIPEGYRKGCQSCHGPGSRHVEDRDRRKIAYYTNLSPAERDQRGQICLGCHRGSPHIHWYGSAHPMNGITCMDCHNPHKTEARRLLREEDPELCFGCHAEKQAQMNYPSRHPLREKKIQCADCHNPHDATNVSLLKETTVNQLCFRCHPEKEGPFTFEHAPVTESCTICHDPHGTTANHLLRESEPFLCMECHANHASGELSFLQDVLDVPAKREAFFTRCTQCHSQIHGTDLPGTTGRGVFTR